MKHALRLSQLCQRNSGEDQLFQLTVLGSNGPVSAVCGWLRPKQPGNQMKAQLDTKAEIVAYHYTAKRMIWLNILIDFR
jgi:hypothetical protein